MVQNHPAHGVQHVLDSMGHIGIGTTVQHYDTPHQHARTLSLDSNMKVLNGSTKHCASIVTLGSQITELNDQ